MTRVLFDLVAIKGNGCEGAAGLDELAPDTYGGWVNWIKWGIELNGDSSPYGYRSRTVLGIYVPPAATSAVLRIRVRTAAGTAGAHIGLFQLDGVPVLTECTWNSRSTGVAWSAPGGDSVGSALDTADGPWSADDQIDLDFSSLALANLGKTVYLLLKQTADYIFLFEGSAVAGWDRNPFVFGT
jgi:hypothetical protein